MKPLCPVIYLYRLPEPFNDDGTYRQDVFYNTLNTNYISIALQAARAADPDAKLYINDYNVEGPGAKSTALQNLVKQLKADNVPIDGVGLQGHFIVGELPGNIQQNIEAFTALGVEVAITELDIRMTLPSTPTLLAQQQKDYQTVITACKNVEGCVGVTIWDYTDKYSWVPQTFSGQGAACPWDAVGLLSPRIKQPILMVFVIPEPCEEACLRWHCGGSPGIDCCIYSCRRGLQNVLLSLDCRVALA